jgi:hypothetical protein
MGFSDQFDHYLPCTDKTVRSAMQAGLVVVDANVLLNLYRFATKARNELFAAFDGLADRIWIPHQVGLEFHKNRLDVISERGTAYDGVLDLIETHDTTIIREIGDKARQLANRVALPADDRDQLLEMVNTLFLPIRKRLDKMREAHGLANMPTPDPILSRLQVIFEERVGAPYNENDGPRVLAEAQRRIKDKVPPGFKDASARGDYFVWRQTLDEVAARQVEYLVFVTSDVKEDWYLRVKGQVICARPELIEEARKEAGCSLVMMRTESFLRNSAEYLDARVSPDTIRQAKELPGALAAPDDQIVDKIATLNDEIADRTSRLQVIMRRVSDIEAKLDRESEVMLDRDSNESLADSVFVEDNNQSAELEALRTERESLRELLEKEITARERLVREKAQISKRNT